MVEALIENNTAFRRASELPNESVRRFIKIIKAPDETMQLSGNEKFTLTDAESLKERKKRRKYEETEIEIVAEVLDVNFTTGNLIVQFRGPKGKMWTADCQISEETKLERIKLVNGSDQTITFIVSAREAEDGELKDLVIVDCA